MPLPEGFWGWGIGITEGREQGIQQHSPGQYIMRINASVRHEDHFNEDLIKLVRERCAEKGWSDPYWIQCQWEYPQSTITKVQLMGKTPN